MRQKALQKHLRVRNSIGLYALENSLRHERVQWHLLFCYLFHRRTEHIFSLVDAWKWDTPRIWMSLSDAIATVHLWTHVSTSWSSSEQDIDGCFSYVENEGKSRCSFGAEENAGEKIASTKSQPFVGPDSGHTPSILCEHSFSDQQETLSTFHGRWGSSADIPPRLESIGLNRRATSDHAFASRSQFPSVGDDHATEWNRTQSFQLSSSSPSSPCEKSSSERTRRSECSFDCHSNRRYSTFE